MTDFLNETEVTLEDILAYNEKRLHEHVQQPFFKMLEDDTLRDQKKRDTFLSCLSIWASYFQQIMFSRQATSVDEQYKSIFLNHLKEEIGHDKLLEKYQKVKINDPILKATSTWFVHQMFVLDNIEKAALVHLVLEASGNEFHIRAAPFFSQYVNTNYFDLHAKVDNGHAEIGIKLLQHQHPVTYGKLLKLIGESWDMFEIMMDRIVYIVNCEGS